MVTDAPDFTTKVNVVIIPTAPELEHPAGEVNRYSGSATEYQSLCTWTVTASRIGELKEVSFVTNNYAKTLWMLVIGSDTMLEDVVIQAPLTIPYFDLRIASETVVALSVKSSDGTAIVADGSIVGKEIGL
ncbi:unnamed protein product [marine sediment metagenome]|uniref:Uncharacterized protein n=1 Tax=marine sediment metagenome TaxID=412755 RepID=X1HDG9_9ZZZZ